MEYQVFFFNIFLYKKKSSCLVLHFVKTINSNINIQLKLKENIFSMLSVLQHSTILLALTPHIFFSFRFPNLLPRFEYLFVP